MVVPSLYTGGTEWVCVVLTNTTKLWTTVWEEMGGLKEQFRDVTVFMVKEM